MWVDRQTDNVSLVCVSMRTSVLPDTSRATSCTQTDQWGVYLGEHWHYYIDGTERATSCRLTITRTPHMSSWSIQKSFHARSSEHYSQTEVHMYDLPQLHRAGPE